MRLQVTGLVWLGIGLLAVWGRGDEYAPISSDPYFSEQWYLEHRDEAGQLLGPDLNVRAAWPWTRGEGVTVAVADRGVELDHPDLLGNTQGAPHFDFANGTTNGFPHLRTAKWAHGTSVAGLVAAVGDNDVGISGVAPNSTLASWVIYTEADHFVTFEQLASMFEHRIQDVWVQTHSWSLVGVQLQPASDVEALGISKAIENGRGGRGVIMVRSGGNGRLQGESANDSEYTADPRVIAVGGMRMDGRVTSSSEPGANILVAGLSGDRGLNGLFTTDLSGGDGVNFLHFPAAPDLSDYRFNAWGIYGTSAAAPQIAGVAAMILSVRADLHYRDVQQVIALSARHFDWLDPDLRRNGAGLWGSHNVGFGLPDAGRAVRLAQQWVSRPAMVEVRIPSVERLAVPDAGLRVLVEGQEVPANLESIAALPSLGLHPDAGTALLPLSDIGLATEPVTVDLNGKGALIRRGGADFAVKIQMAAAAGAAFAIVYNNEEGSAGCAGGDQLCPMGGTDFVTIPAVFIGHTAGSQLAALIQSGSLIRARVGVDKVSTSFEVTESLLVEQVGLRVQSTHPVRGDLRISLVSPQGTRSVLQRINADLLPGPEDWTYWSVQHLYEQGAGTWTAEFVDEFPDAVGEIVGAELVVLGTPMEDSDRDGLEDGWEREHFGNLLAGPAEDPDADSEVNLVEQLIGTDPAGRDLILRVDLDRWKENSMRLSWPSVTNRVYQVLSGSEPADLRVQTNLTGHAHVTEWMTAATNDLHRFFAVREVEP